jgi:molybdopterin-guanine dinucleotide biosynthesis protein A
MYAAVILAGGAARRVGGATKPALRVGGQALLNRVLAAASPGRPRIVVGPDELADLLPADVTLTRENPPGGGPVAAIAAGLSCLAPTDPPAHADPPALVVILAADLPFLSSRTLETLRRVLIGQSVGAETDQPGGAGLDGAVLVDEAGRPQWLAGIWRLASLVERLDTLGDPAGRAVRDLLGGGRAAHVRLADEGPPPWFDCDTEEDLRRAQEWTDAR